MKVLVICLPIEQRLTSSSAELIGGAKRAISAMGGTVEAAVFGDGIADACREAAAFGADAVYGVEDCMLIDFDAEAYLQALQAVVSQSAPDAVLFTADNASGELAPRLAHRLRSGAITDAVRMDVTEGRRFVFTRPAYGGRLMAEIAANYSPVVATLMSGCMEALAKDESRAVDIESLKVHWSGGTGLVRTVEVEIEEGIPLEGARVVVSGGRGMEGSAGFQELEELAVLLGGTVGASRAAVDEGWVSPSRQVGQTGKNVAPELYIAVGISGASQHLAGMSRSKHVIVINSDLEAPFYRIAEVGVAADYMKLLPPLTARLRELLQVN